MHDFIHYFIYNVRKNINTALIQIENNILKSILQDTKTDLTKGPDHMNEKKWEEVKLLVPPLLNNPSNKHYNILHLLYTVHTCKTHTDMLFSLNILQTSSFIALSVSCSIVHLFFCISLRYFSLQEVFHIVAVHLQ